MIIGTTLFKLDGSDYFTPEFSRGGLAAVFPVDVTHLSNTNGVTFQVQHRNSEEQTFGNVSGASSTTGGTPDVLDIDAGGLKEIIRIQVTFDPGDSPQAAVHFLIQAPTWRPY